jgi:hypothetical protein
MRIATVWTVLLAGALLVGQGCVGRLIDEGIEKVLGPTPKLLPLDPKWPEKDPAYLASYRNFELVLPIKSEFPDTPAEFMTYLPTKFAEQMGARDLPTGKQGKTLLVNVTILAYQPVASYNKALGPTEEVVARVELVDKDTTKLVGKAVCIGRTYQSIGLGPKWKAWGLCRAIVDKWLDEYYPKEGRKAGEEKPPPSEGAN